MAILTALAALGCTTTVRAQDYGDPVQIVRYWFQSYLGREAEESGALYFADQLRRGNSPESVLSGILGSDEYYRRGGSTPEGFVRLLFIDTLGRPPTPVELDLWTRRMWTANRQDIAYQMLTGNPGSWVGTFRLPERERFRYRDREHERERERIFAQERERELRRRHDEHDYRRPELPYRH